MAEPDDPLHDLNGAELEPAGVDAGPPSTPTDELGRDVPDGWPVGVYVGDGVETIWIGEHEYTVDPETGRVTGRR